MHIANSIFWKYVSNNFSPYFNDDILEFGSYNINGTIKDYFNKSKNYVGIDWREGPCVDVVGLAHEIKFDYKARAVFSASMLEHDPFWRKSLKNMINHLTDDGILVLTWGSAKNDIHCLPEAPDGKFHSLKAELVMNFLTENGFTIHTAVYDGNLSNIIDDVGDLKILKSGNCFPENIDGYGEFNLIAFRQDFNDVNGFITELMTEDKLVI